MQKQSSVAGNDVIPNHPLPPIMLGERAKEAVQAGASQVVAASQRTVRRYPLASLGFALGGGLAIAAVGYAISHRRDAR
jgi:hypothetical protein